MTIWFFDAASIVAAVFGTRAYNVVLPYLRLRLYNDGGFVALNRSPDDEHILCKLIEAKNNISISPLMVKEKLNNVETILSILNDPKAMYSRSGQFIEGSGKQYIILLDAYTFMTPLPHASFFYATFADLETHLEIRKVSLFGKTLLEAGDG